MACVYTPSGTYSVGGEAGMTIIRVDTEIYQEIAQQLNRVAESLGTSERTVSSLHGIADLFIPKRLGVHSELQHIEKRIKKNRTDTVQLSQAVLTAADKFIKCEKKLSGQETHASAEIINFNGQLPIFQLIDSILDSLGISKIIKNVIKNVDQYFKQKARDAEMQGELRDLLGENEFSESAWKSASIDERKEMIRNALERMNAVYGINVNKEIDFLTDKPSSYRGHHVDTDNIIGLNEKNLKNGDYQQVMTTLIHEMRHAYQRAVVADPDQYVVSKETAKTWEDNYAPGHYKEPPKEEDYAVDREKARQKFKEYEAQPVEKDARDLSEGVLSG
jgi:hypothetical protein